MEPKPEVTADQLMTADENSAFFKALAAAMSKFRDGTTVGDVMTDEEVCGILRKAIGDARAKEIFLELGIARALD